MEGQLTADQQTQLNRDALDREPIGADEILLVGDIRYGTRVLKSHCDGIKGIFAIDEALRREDCPHVAAFLAWTRSGIEASAKTLKEVQRLRDLVARAESEASLN